MDQVTQPSRLYDRETAGPVQVHVQQVDASYRVLRQLGYRDPRYQQPFIVPDDVDAFRTDLASIPWMFAWLVPGLGTHLPAVLLHDGLVVGRGQVPTKHHATGTSTRTLLDQALRRRQLTPNIVLETGHREAIVPL